MIIKGTYTKFSSADGSTIKKKKVNVWLGRNETPPVLCIAWTEGKEITIPLTELRKLLKEY